MKKIMIALALLCAVCSGAWAVGGEWIYQEETEMSWGELRWFDDKQLDELAPKGKTAWHSTNGSAATVDRWGNVQAAEVDALAETYIIAERGGYTHAWKVTVRPRSQQIVLHADGAELTERVLNLDAGERQVQITASVLPEGAPAHVAFSVSGKGASIDENGLLTVERAGRYTVTAKAQDKGRASAQAQVVALHPVASVSLTGPLSLTGGQSAKLEAAIAPENATVRDLIFTSSDPNVLTVDKNGVMTAQKVSVLSTAVVTARAADGFGAACDFSVTVVPAAEKVDILLGGESCPTQALVLDQSLIGTIIDLDFTLSPAEAQQEVKWTSSNNDIVKMDSSGRLGICGRGTCRITARAADGSGASRTLLVAVSSTQKLPYYLEIDRGNQVVRVYEKDESGLYTRLARRMVCSTGTHDGGYSTGFYTADSARARWMSTVIEGVYCQYGTRFYDQIWFHSLPYTGTNANRMDMTAYEQLGTRASHGCIRLLCADAKWIYDNVPGGCWINVCKCERTESEYGAVSWPQAQGGWDPTDGNEKNPYYDPTYTSAVSNP